MGIRKINESTLTAIGNAIRSKTGGSALINPENMASEIESIVTSGGDFVVHKGEVTVASSGTTKVTIQHGFNVIPFICAIYPKEQVETSEKRVVGGMTATPNGIVKTLPFTTFAIGKVGWYTDSQNRRGATEVNGANYLKNITSSSFDLTSSSSYPLLETTYEWIAIAAN